MKNISNIIGMTTTSLVAVAGTSAVINVSVLVALFTLVAVAGTSAVIRGFNQFPKLKKKVKKKSRK